MTEGAESVGGYRDLRRETQKNQRWNRNEAAGAYDRIKKSGSQPD